MHPKLQLLGQEISSTLRTINIKCNDSEIDDLVMGLKLLMRNNNTDTMISIAQNIVLFAKNNKSDIVKEDLRILNSPLHPKYDVNKYFHKYMSKFNKEDIADIWQQIKKIISLALDVF